MVLEHALLNVRPGYSTAFEAALQKARPQIAASPGFVSIEVRAAIEHPDRYLLTVGWEDIASHRDGFRTSDRCKNWCDLLHCFYDPMPATTYFAESIL